MDKICKEIYLCLNIYTLTLKTLFAEAPNKILAMRTESRLLEKSGRKSIFDLVLFNLILE